VDSGSTDKTIDIATQNGAKVISKTWLGFGRQKQFAVTNAKNDWIMSIDADEYLSEELLLEILNLNLHPKEFAFKINRRSFLLGKPVRFSGWNPDWVVRVFNRKICRFSNVDVHEKVIGASKEVKLKKLLYHTPFRTNESIQKKIHLYGQLGKQNRSKIKNKYLSAGWSFIRTYIFKLGLLDGITGFKVALINAKISWIKYS